MLVLDTDILSLVQTSQGAEAQRLLDRIRTSGEMSCVTIVTFQEQMRGRLAQCAKAVNPDQYILAARLLHLTYEDYHTRTILDFDEDAAAEFRRLKAAKVRIGTMDLRIAAITLARGALLLTRNLTDFRKVPGLRVEDWTTPA